jgi:hypothetical protein
MHAKRFGLAFLFSVACAVAAGGTAAAAEQQLKINPEILKGVIAPLGGPCLNGFAPSVANPNPRQGSYFCASPVMKCAPGFDATNPTVTAAGAFHYECQVPPKPPR